MGLPVSEVLQFTPAEYEGWLHHLARYPAGDFYAQHILAHIWLVVAQYVSDPKHRPRSIYEVAPWLERPQDRRSRLDAEKEQADIQLAADVSAAYDSRRTADDV